MTHPDSFPSMQLVSNQGYQREGPQQGRRCPDDRQVVPRPLGLHPQGRPRFLEGRLQRPALHLPGHDLRRRRLLAAIRHLTAALELLDGLPEDEPHLRQRWEVVSNLSKAYSDCRAFERAQDVLEEYLALAQRARYPWGMATAHFETTAALSESLQAAGTFHSEGSRRLIMERFEQGLQIAEQHGLTEWRARARTKLAYLLSRHRHDLPRAEALLREKADFSSGRMF